MDNFLGFLTVCCHPNTNSQEGHPASLSVYKDKTEKTNAVMVVVKTEETKIFTCLKKCLIAGCLWTKIFIYFHLKVSQSIYWVSNCFLTAWFWFFLFFFSLGWCTAYCHSSVVFALAVLYTVYRGMKCLISLSIFYLNLLSWRQGMKWSFFFFKSVQEDTSFLFFLQISDIDLRPF